MEMVLARSARAVFYAFLACLFGFGIALICVGSTHTRTTAEYNHWLYYPAVSSPILAVFCGCGLLCLTVLGFVSALKEYSTGLIIFACILGGITIVEIVGGALAAAGSTRSASSLQHRMEISLRKYFIHDKDKAAWDKLQRNVQCCGTTDSSQWNPGRVPLSCCPDHEVKDTTKPEFCQPKDQIFRRGCYRPLSSSIKTSMDELAYMCLIFSFFQIFAMGLSLYLAYAIKRERDLKQAVVEVLKEGGESAASRSRTPREPIAISTIITEPTS